MTENDTPLTISQIYEKGKERLISIGYKRAFPPDSAAGATLRANREYLDSLFFKTSFLNPVEVETNIEILGIKLKTPIFCSPMSGFNQLSKTALTEIAAGLKNAGSLLMLGIGGSPELQSAIDTGVPVIKLVKPYRNTELMFEKIKDAESRGCVAVGMDIDYYNGALRGGVVTMTDLFAPQSNDTLRQLISSTRLPFIIKGILSVQDAEEAIKIGAKAIIVSTHGSSTVDFAVPSIIALQDIVKAVGTKVPVLIDSGFKTGNDVLKALAMGARAVGFGGSVLLAWGAGEERGVENFINQLTAELGRTMASTGCAKPSVANKSILVQVPPK